MKIKLGNGLVVNLEVNQNNVCFKYGEEFVSFCPSMEKAGASMVNTSNLLFKTNGEVLREDENGCFHWQKDY